MVNVEIANNEADAQFAYKLFYRCFDSPNAKISFDLTRQYDPTLKNENLFIIKDERQNVIAALRTVVRTMRILGEEFKVGGIATTAVHPDYRKRGFFDVLTKYALEKMKERNLDLCLVFARRAIDNIYIKYGFWGLPVERRITLLNPPIINESKMEFRNVQATDIGFLEKIYNKSYGILPVSLNRPGQLWLAKIKNPDFEKNYKCVIFTKKNEPVGYVVAENEKGIIEVGSMEEKQDIYREMLFSKVSPVKEYAVKCLALPFEHPAIKSVSGYGYSIFTRHPDFGGHVIRILNPYNTNSKIMKLVNRELIKRGAALPDEPNGYASYIYSRVLISALLGYEIVETRTVLKIIDKDRWNSLKPIDVILSSLDAF